MANQFTPNYFGSGSFVLTLIATTTLYFWQWELKMSQVNYIAWAVVIVFLLL